MSAPNHFSVVQQVYSSGHYDLTTKMGTGRFEEDCAWALHQTDQRWGQLKKPNSLGGANHWNHHAVDAVCWRSDQPGQTQAVDIVRAGESTSAAIGWQPDQPRYQSSDWYAPSGPSQFVLPSHSCRLGASLFWLLGGWKLHRSQVIQNLEWIKFTLKADYIRAMFCCTGVKAWSLIGSDPAWHDFDSVVRESTAYCKSINLTIAWTLVGEAAGVPHGDALALVDRYHLLVDHSNTELSEMWNEYRLTGGNVQTIRAMAQRLRQHLGSSHPIALDTPHLAMTAPIGEGGDPLAQEVSAFYGGSAANVITPQWDRSQPNPRDMGPDCPSLIYSHEPRGPGASAGGDVSDPLPLTHDYIQSALSAQIHGFGRFNARGQTAHAMPGAWGGHCHPDFPEQNRYANWFDVPNAAAIASAYAAVRAGFIPPDTGGGGGGGTDPTMPIPPYDEQWISNTVRPAVLDRYTRAQKPLDDLYPVWITRTLYDHDAGMTKEASLEKHLHELDVALGLA